MTSAAIASNAGWQWAYGPPDRRHAVKLPWIVRLVLCYLVTITVLGKGPTYLIYPPVFWGELVLLAGLLWLVNERGLINAFLPVFDALTWAVIAFSLIGLYITIRFLPLYGLDAIRDAALWYYGGFFFIGAHLARDETRGNKAWRVLRIAWLVALCWGVADILSGLRLSRMGPVLPWRGEPLLSNSHYEIVEHVGLASLIIFNRRWSADILGSRRIYLLPLAILGLACAFSSAGRGVKLGLLCAIASMLPLKFAPGQPLEISKRLLAILAIAVILLLTVVVFLEDEAQTLAKIAHVDRFAGADPSSPTGTAYWRVIWWKRLVHEVMTRNPVFGLGFGESLNVYNPYLRGNEKTQWPTRSPHNINITVLSRMGLSGSTVWAVILLLGLGGLWFRTWKGQYGGVPYTKERREEIAFWTMMLLTTLINSSFGVLMEGPVLGVWFWFALGFAWVRSRAGGAVPPRRLRLTAYPAGFARRA